MITENTILIKDQSKSSRKYLKSTIIEPDITLNEIASDIYNYIDGKNNVKDICNLLIKEYNIDYETCLKDTLELIQQLIDYKIIYVK
ncbi:hypothetical protein HNR43_002397 [Anoxybacillus mongoliensis]|uniref:PqqD family protein n=1 Tax=Anoxybacillus mongoliensis TaxID=452565 RepID=A0A7W8N9B1_9BACL|nr:PqqD family protein [Anoxybacillus mongoliensis]MBB5356413.1 hypothetical protein [Anoxybacillus mongoliensis]